MEYDEFNSHFSDEITPEIKTFGDFALAQCDLAFLVVPEKEHKDRAYCTHCKKFVKIPEKNVHAGAPWKRRYYVRYNDDSVLRIMDIEKNKIKMCPSCKQQLYVYHKWRLAMDTLAGFVSISVWQKSKIDSSAITMQRFEILRQHTVDGKFEDYYRPAERYLFRMGQKALRARCKPFSHYEFDRVFTFIKKINDTANYSYCNLNATVIKGFFEDTESFERCIKDTPYQYCCHNKVQLANHLVNYMDLFSRRPWVELLIKNGLGKIVEDHVKGDGCQGAIKWQAHNFKSAISRFQKKDLKEIMEFNKTKTLSEMELALWAGFKKLFPEIGLNLVHIMTKGRDWDVLSKLMRIKKLQLHLNINTATEYCKKQARERKKDHAMGDWLDYLADAQMIGLDLTDKSNVYPKNLYRMHANVITQIKYKENTDLDKAIEKLAAMRKKLFCFDNGMYLIRPAESTSELIAEGKCLHHCVGGYAERYARGQTHILLLREKKDPETPFVTIEVHQSVNGSFKIWQMHGYMNDISNPLPKSVKEAANLLIKFVNDRVKEEKKEVKKVRIRVA